MLMEVFDDRIELERWDWKNSVPLGDDWVIPLGKDAARPYLRESRTAKLPPPEFPSGSEVSVRYLAEGRNRIGEKDPQIEISFPPLNGISNKGARAFDFEVAARWRGKDGSSREKIHRFYSPNALLPPQFDIQPVKCRFQAAEFDDRDGGEIAFLVTPLNEWGKKGRPIKTGWSWNSLWVLH
jgi:hypothetical protein